MTGQELNTYPKAGSNNDLSETIPLPLSVETLSASEVEQAVLAMLLVSPEPALITDLAIGADVSNARILEAVCHLQKQPDASWVVVQHGDRVELTTHPRYSTVVRRFLRLDREVRLSPAALETLPIVAYRQPVTRAEIELVRGVDCSGVLSTLTTRGLLESLGRAPGLGSPLQYTTTAAFLHHFGLSSIADLPPLGSIEGKDAVEVLVKRSTVTEPGEDDAQPERMKS